MSSLRSRSLERSPIPWDAVTQRPLIQQRHPNLRDNMQYSLERASNPIHPRPNGQDPDYTVDQIRLGLGLCRRLTDAAGRRPTESGARVPDDVRIELDIVGPTAVPEPGTMLLLGSGIVAAGLRRSATPAASLKRDRTVSTREDETRPVVRVLPRAGAQHLQLNLTQGC